MHTVAIIPARGGSKGVPLKNIREVAGRPLISYVIDACLHADSVDRVVVSTDHAQIAQIARACGAEVPFMRPAELAGDLVTLDPVVWHAVTALEGAGGPPIDVVLTIQPTAPLLSAATIEHSVRTLIEGGYDSVLMIREHRHLYWRRVNGHYEPMFARRVNRQELEPLFTEMGSVFASRRDIMTPNNRLGANIGHMIGPDDEALDIDSEVDLMLAELIIERSRQEGRA